MKSSGRELLAGLANVIVAERPTKLEKNPGDFMAPRPGRTQLAKSSDQKSAVRVVRGPVATTAEVSGALLQAEARSSSAPASTMTTPESTLKRNSTRFRTTPSWSLNFPFVKTSPRFAAGFLTVFRIVAGATPNADLHGWNNGIVPAVRWMDFQTRGWRRSSPHG